MSQEKPVAEPKQIKDLKEKRLAAGRLLGFLKHDGSRHRAYHCNIVMNKLVTPDMACCRDLYAWTILFSRRTDIAHRASITPHVVRIKDYQHTGVPAEHQKGHN